MPLPPYTPDPSNAAEPTDGRAAGSAAPEFQALKARVNALASSIPTAITAALQRVLRVPASDTINELPAAVDRDGYLTFAGGQPVIVESPIVVVDLPILQMVAVRFFADIATTTFVPQVQRIQTAGYSAVGKGAAAYKRTSNTGETLYRTQSLDGAWWELAEDHPDVFMVGGKADATTGTPTPTAPIINVLASAGCNKHDLWIGDNYTLAGSSGAFSVGSEVIKLTFEQSLTGYGWATKFLAQAAPSVYTFFGLNTNGAGSWVNPFPGELNSKVKEFYFDGQPAEAAALGAGQKLVALEFGGSYHFSDIHFGRVHTAIKQINQYCDLITVERVTMFDQTDNTEWAFDLKWAGDACRIDQIHCFRKAVANPADARAPKGVRLRYKVGSTVSNLINGDHLMEGCDGIHVTALHQEDGVFTWQESSGTLSNANFWMRGDSLGLSAVPLQVTYGTYTSLYPSVVHWSDIGFVYQETFPGGYTTTKHNFNIKQTPFEFTGFVRIDRLFRKSKPEGGLASMGQKYGVSCGEPEFDNYSHFASVASEYKNSRWHIYGVMEEIPGADAILDSENSTLDVDYKFTAASGTYYYRAQLLCDKIRKIGITGNELSLSPVNGGVSSVLVLTSQTKLTAMFRIYRGTSTDSYNNYVDVPMIAGARFVDAGGDIGGYPWIARAAGPVDPLNVGTVMRYELSPGGDVGVTAAYGHVEVLVNSNAQMPNRGTWIAGDTYMLTFPVDDGFQMFHGWKRKITGSNHGEQTDWVRINTYLKDPIASGPQFTNIANTINTINKTTGRCVYDATTQKPLWAKAAATDSVWIDATGATIYTPV